MKIMPTPLDRRRARGFSLVELLVAVAIGLVVTLAVFGVLTASENRKRTTSAINDSNQVGAYSALILDRAILNAGSGFAQRWDDIGGCMLEVDRGGVAVWPRATALPLPFTGLLAAAGSVPPHRLRLVPLVIVKDGSDAGSDALIIMSGAAGFAEAPIPLKTGLTTTASVDLDNSIGIRGDDLMVVAQDNNCLVQQVTPLFAGGAVKTVPFAGTYATASGASLDLMDFGDVGAVGPGFAFSIGNNAAATLNPPSFSVYGVGANDTLFSLDLLRLDGRNESVPLADGVAALRAVYAVDTNSDGAYDTWVAADAPGWTAAQLLDGSANARRNLRSIRAVRLALVMRTTVPERDDVAPATIPLFADLPGIAGTQDYDVANQRLRHRVVELTVPLRNLLLLP